MSKPHSSRIPSLDGARAVSILLVVAFHIDVLHRIPGLWRVDFGNLGVRTFFVISGFLITTLLLRELQSFGSIDIRSFYVRRAFRILPAYYVFLSAVALLVAARIIHGRESEMLPAVFYFSNYKLPFLDIQQSWSLSVEEQFYFLWPAAIAFLGLRRASRGCMFVLLISPLIRVLYDLGYWHIPNEEFGFGCACDAIASGCLLSIYREQLWGSGVYRRMIGWAWVITIAALMIWALSPPPIVRDVISIPMLNVGIVLLLDRYMRLAQTTHVGRILNFGPLVWIGTISYSIYLCQQPWMFSHLEVLVRLAGGAACAVALYYLVERPVIRLRNRIARAPEIAPVRAAVAP